MTDVFVVGALHLDVVVDAPRLPALDETLMGAGVAYRFGGKGGNQALAAARMGASVAMAGRVGSDGFAAPVLDALDRAGVDRAQVRQVEGATGMSVAIVDAQGDYGAVVVSGVNRSIDPAEVDPGGAAVILMQNEISEAVNLAVARVAPGARIILNAAPARAVATDLMTRVEFLVVNRIEAAQIIGSVPENLDAAEAALALARLGPRVAIVTLGGAGVVICDGSAVEAIAPPTVARGSAHGAGDAFVGALAAEMARGTDLAVAVRFAMAAAAHFVQTPPENRAHITRRDVEAWAAAL